MTHMTLTTLKPLSPFVHVTPCPNVGKAMHTPCCPPIKVVVFGVWWRAIIRIISFEVLFLFVGHVNWMIAHHNIRRNKFIGSSQKLAQDALQPQIDLATQIYYLHIPWWIFTEIANGHMNWTLMLLWMFNPNPMNGHGIEHWIHEFSRVPTPHSPTKTPNSHLCHIVEVYSCPREGNCFEEGK